MVDGGGAKKMEKKRQWGDQTRCRAWLWGQKTGAGVNPNQKMEITEGGVKEMEELESWLFMVLRYSSEDPRLAAGLVFCKPGGKLILERL